MFEQLCHNVIGILGALEKFMFQPNVVVFFFKKKTYDFFFFFYNFVDVGRLEGSLTKQVSIISLKLKFLQKILKN